MTHLKTIHMLVNDILRTKGWPVCEPPARFIAQDGTGSVYAYYNEIKFERNDENGAWTSAGNEYCCLPDTGNWALGNHPLAVDYKTQYVMYDAYHTLDANDVDSW
jgi:hypothetical protein